MAPRSTRTASTRCQRPVTWPAPLSRARRLGGAGAAGAPGVREGKGAGRGLLVVAAERPTKMMNKQIRTGFDAGKVMFLEGESGLLRAEEVPCNRKRRGGQWTRQTPVQLSSTGYSEDLVRFSPSCTRLRSEVEKSLLLLLRHVMMTPPQILDQSQRCLIWKELKKIAPVELREHNLQLFFTALVFLLVFLTISSLEEGEPIVTSSLQSPTKEIIHSPILLWEETETPDKRKTRHSSFER
ncbi:uncharacterized protein LOC136003283 [Lathamus discolor]|uniref:uncharacterized protein LOC136003283 n=1 Tax=Lathamus discolor TaxID=678569 RepID=UPI0032B77803